MEVWRSVAWCLLMLVLGCWSGKAARIYTLDDNDFVFPVHHGHRGADVFLAVPYADPYQMGPAGDLDPKPIGDKDWQYYKQRVTDFPSSARFGHLCPQQQPQPGPQYYESYYGMKPSVSCLSLNVFSPQRMHNPTNKTYPVLVLFHGGRLVSGSAADFGMRGLSKRFVKKGFVVVTVSYRVGEEGASDRALLDVVSALKYIQGHIGRLQGDPKRVTLYGYEHGGCMVSYLTQLAMVDTNYEHLFGNVVIQSGWSRMCAKGGAFPAWSHDNSSGVVLTGRVFTPLRWLAEWIETAVDQGSIAKTKRKILFITGLNEGAVYETHMKKAFDLPDNYYEAKAEELFEKMHPGYNENAKQKSAIDYLIRSYKFNEVAEPKERHKRWLLFLNDIVVKSGVIRDTSLLAVQHDVYIAVVNYTGPSALEFGQTASAKEAKLALEGNFTSAETVFALTFLPEHRWNDYRTMAQVENLTREMQLGVDISDMIDGVGKDANLTDLGWVKQAWKLPTMDPKFLDFGSDDDGLLIGKHYIDWEVLSKFAVLNPVYEPFQGKVDTGNSMVTTPAPLRDEIGATAVVVADEKLFVTGGLGYNGTV